MSASVRVIVYCLVPRLYAQTRGRSRPRQHRVRGREIPPYRDPVKKTKWERVNNNLRGFIFMPGGSERVSEFRFSVYLHLCVSYRLGFTILRLLFSVHRRLTLLCGAPWPVYLHCLVHKRLYLLICLLMEWISWLLGNVWATKRWLEYPNVLWCLGIWLEVFFFQTLIGGAVIGVGKGLHFITCPSFASLYIYTAEEMKEQHNIEEEEELSTTARPQHTTTTNNRINK